MTTDEDPLSNGEQPPPGQGVYGIGVAADLIGTGIQNLRAYERAGLVSPDRTAGGNRLYSPDDIVRIRRVQALLAQGLNLAGIAQVLELQDDNQRLRHQMSDDARPPDRSLSDVDRPSSGSE